jgi:hypothetical protein
MGPRNTVGVLTDARFANGLGIEHAHAFELPHEDIPALERLLQGCAPLLRHPALLEGIHGLQNFSASFLLLQTQDQHKMKRIGQKS